jgi:glycosyltransferase involved in cell wall biosynthesis
MYNTFDPAPDPGDRAATRARLGLGGEELLVLQPTRAIARKRVPAGIAFAEALGATFWLTGRVEDGYDEQLAVELAAAAVPIVRGTGATRPGREIDDAYAAADVVVLPSAWEGFGNPALEAATHRRPLAIADYPVARELRRFGFRWFGLDEHRVVTRWLAAPDPGLLDVNAALARRHFSSADLPGRLARLIGRPAGRATRRPSRQPAGPVAIDGAISGE